MRSGAGRSLGACLAAALLLASSGGSRAAPAASPLSYDRKAPLGLRDRGPVNHGYPIVVHDISYASPRGGRVTAYVAVPPGHGPFPAVIYAHGSGGSRRDLLPDAVWMAARGAVTMTIDDPFARNPQLENASEARQLAALEQDVVDLRRAVDVLQSRADVDGRRIAFVGLSLGARVGAVLAGVEPRIEAFDLMSGRGAPLGEPALDELSGLHHAHARFFFQLGRRDEIVPRPQLLALVNAAPKSKTVRWYDAGHVLDLAAEHDQLVWLSRQLGLDGPIVAGALPGP